MEVDEVNHDVYHWCLARIFSYPCHFSLSRARTHTALVLFGYIHHSFRSSSSDSSFIQYTISETHHVFSFDEETTVQSRGLRLSRMGPKRNNPSRVRNAWSDAATPKIWFITAIERCSCRWLPSHDRSNSGSHRNSNCPRRWSTPLARAFSLRYPATLISILGPME